MDKTRLRELIWKAENVTDRVIRAVATFLEVLARWPFTLGVITCLLVVMLIWWLIP